MGVSSKKKVRKGMEAVSDKLALVQSTANAEGEKWKKNNPETPTEEKDAQNPDQTQGKHESGDATMANAQGEQPPAQEIFNIEQAHPILNLLADLKGEKEKFEKSLKKILNLAIVRAPAQKMAEYEAKRKKMFDEYNHKINHRADQLPITKISYKVNSSKETTIRITIVFQREEEFCLATTAQLIRLHSAIQRGTLEAEEMFKKRDMTIEARNDVNQAREIVQDNLDGLDQNMLSVEEPLSARLSGIEGLAECKALARNLRRIQVKDIVKEDEDHMKTYSSAGMDSWYVEGIHCGSKES
ncbi:hypothetical protein Tco_1326889 [Tanacetum coccineum]